VQFAAAVAILKSPAVVTHGQSARIVDILRRALAGEVDGSGAGKIGRVLIADPDAARGNKLAASFRTAGFTAERLATGRDLIARIARASDYDAIIVDRHIPNPLLGDLLSHIADDPNAARRPTLVVASTDKLQPLPLEHQLLRLALLVAATETDAESLKVLDPDPKPSANNKITRLFEGKEITITVPQARDATLAELMRLRAARLQRLLKSSDLPLNRGLQTRLELRRDQYTLAALAIQYRINESSAPTINNQLVTLTDVIARRTDLAGEAEKLLPSDLENMVRLIEQLESGLSPEQKKFFEYLREKITPASLALDAEIVRDEAMERRVAKIVKPFRFITVIPETFDPSTLASDLKVAAIDPAKLPRDPEERLAVAKQAADWLRKIAIGEASGYDARSASVELRAALRSDAFADLVVEAVARLATADAQRELVEVASNVKRPSAIRIKAADAALRHIQAFGKMTPAAVAETAAVVAASETDPAVKSRLDVLARQVAVVPVDLSGVIRSFPLTPALPVPPPPKLPDPKEPKEPEPPKM